MLIWNKCSLLGLMSTHLDMAPNFAGTLLGITNGFANIMGFMAPAFTGYIINEKEDIEHWRFVFFVGKVHFIILIRSSYPSYFFQQIRICLKMKYNEKSLQFKCSQFDRSVFSTCLLRVWITFVASNPTISMNFEFLLFYWLFWCYHLKKKLRTLLSNTSAKHGR